jgi:Putative MetA-pathway of phenol degradation
MGRHLWARAHRGWTIVLLTLVTLPGAYSQPSAAEQEPELLTDRPDFTETSFVVPLHRLQLEAGFTYADGAGGERTFNAPELLLRYGVASRTELRLGLPDYVRVRGNGQRVGQFGDTYLGVKQQLGPPGARFGLALIPAVTLPTGGSQLTSDRVDPEIVLAWSRDLSAAWSVGGIFGYARPTEDGSRNDTFFPTVSFGRALSDRWGTFFEWAAEFPERGGDVHLFHHGYTYALRSNSQLDLHFGVGLTRAAPDFFIGAGFAVRR